MRKLISLSILISLTLAACSTPQLEQSTASPIAVNTAVPTSAEIEGTNNVATASDIAETRESDDSTGYPPPEQILDASANQDPYPVSTEDNYLPLVTGPGFDPSLISSLEMTSVGGGFDRPVFVTHAGDETLYVVEQAGTISILENGQKEETAFLDITDRVGSRSSEQGLLSAVFHPDYAENQRFFVYYTDKNGDVVISEFMQSADPDAADPTSERIILEVAQPYANHNGGQLQFGPDGFLYIGLGDGGSGGDPDCNGLDEQALLGKILRIDIDSSQQYAIPADNPFVDDDAFRSEIWSWGLRNPWRFSFDRENGDMFIADVGQNAWEEVNWESAESTGGVNYGWNNYEGSHFFSGACGSAENAQLPFYEYGRTEGRSITGGYIYRGQESAPLFGNYIFADFATGNIWASVQSEPGTWQTRLVEASGIAISSFGEGPNGELYLVDYGGTIFELSAGQ